MKIKYHSALGEAYKSLKTAEHMFSVAYPFTHDTKLLLAILRNIHASHNIALSILDQHIRRGLSGAKTHRERIIWLQQEWQNIGIEKNMVDMLSDLDLLLQMQKASPIEFVRRDKFVICTDTYNLRIISGKEVSNYLFKTKVFIEKINSMLTK